jgi:phosphoribosylanthranilate isomerase
MFIKICGMTSASSVVAAVECGVDAIGFVFAPSPRRLSPAEAAHYAVQAPADLLTVAVTWHPSQALLDEILAVLQPDILQTDLSDLADLEVPAQLGLLPVMRDTGDDSLNDVTDEHLPRRLLFEGQHSGTGKPANWAAAEKLARRSQLILAGGLDASNVAGAIAHVRPFGVDVSSGVESAPGVKDARRMAEFVTAVRHASRDVAVEAATRGAQ